MSSPLAPRRFDPLTDILLRSTVGGAAPASGGARAARSADSPARDAVSGGRAAILDGARAAVLANGTRVTMAQVAARAGVAKATLYNHFRARDDVLAAVLLDELDRLIQRLSHLPLDEALRRAAAAVSEHPLLEALGSPEDAPTLAALARVDTRGAGWARVARTVSATLAATGRGGTPTVLRWLGSFVLAPADPADIDDDVAVLVAGLPPLR